MTSVSAETMMDDKMRLERMTARLSDAVIVLLVFIARSPDMFDD